MKLAGLKIVDGLKRRKLAKAVGDLIDLDMSLKIPDEVIRKWNHLRKFLRERLEGEARYSALGFLSKLPISIIVADDHRHKYRLLDSHIAMQEFFPEVIPDKLIQYIIDARKKGLLPNHVLAWSNRYPGEDLFCKTKIKEAITRKMILSSTNEVSVDIRQSFLPIFYCPLKIDHLEEALRAGLSERLACIDSKNEEAKDKQITDSLIPLKRKFNKDELDQNKVFAIVDFDYIIPRSFQHAECDWLSFIAGDDSWRSSVDHISADKITGLICLRQSADRVIKILADQNQKIRVYNESGDLIWPNRKRHWRVKGEFRRRLLQTMKKK